MAGPLFLHHSFMMDWTWNFRWVKFLKCEVFNGCAPCVCVLEFWTACDSLCTVSRRLHQDALSRPLDLPRCSRHGLDRSWVLVGFRRSPWEELTLSPNILLLQLVDVGWRWLDKQVKRQKTSPVTLIIYWTCGKNCWDSAYHEKLPSPFGAIGFETNQVLILRWTTRRSCVEPKANIWVMSWVYIFYFWRWKCWAVFRDW